MPRAKLVGADRDLDMALIVSALLETIHLTLEIKCDFDPLTYHLRYTFFELMD